MNEEMIRMIKTDKKANTEYWDAMDAKIDISKAVLETIINKCKEYGINTEVAFPFIDEDY